MLPGWGLAGVFCLSVCCKTEGRDRSVRDPQLLASLYSLFCSQGGSVVRNGPGRAGLLTWLQSSRQALGLGPTRGARRAGRGGAHWYPTQASRWLGTWCRLHSHTTPLPGGTAWPTQVGECLEMKPPELLRGPPPPGLVRTGSGAGLRGGSSEPEIMSPRAGDQLMGLLGGNSKYHRTQGTRAQV